VREKSVDLNTGALRPREISGKHETIPGHPAALAGALAGDPTIYARVDYFDENANITAAESASCRTILKNLPVIFTFAPMNLLHYRVKFPPKTTETLTVGYKQYAFRDTKSPASFQLAYVLHPASLWEDFGPINLKVALAEGVPFRASVPCECSGVEELQVPGEVAARALPDQPRKQRFTVYEATIAGRTGELLLGFEAEAWKNALAAQAHESKRDLQASR
jgi:hypothetical protein